MGRKAVDGPTGAWTRPREGSFPNSMSAHLLLPGQPIVPIKRSDGTPRMNGRRAPPRQDRRGLGLIQTQEQARAETGWEGTCSRPISARRMNPPFRFRRWWPRRTGAGCPGSSSIPSEARTAAQPGTRGASGPSHSFPGDPIARQTATRSPSWQCGCEADAAAQIGMR